MRGRILFKRNRIIGTSLSYYSLKIGKEVGDRDVEVEQRQRCKPSVLSLAIHSVQMDDLLVTLIYVPTVRMEAYQIVSFKL
jgi:hypothetical protein